MSDYNKLKVDDLKKLLADRSLPLTGKKADFVSRLVEQDRQQSIEAATSKVPDARIVEPAPRKSEQAESMTKPQVDRTNQTSSTKNKQVPASNSRTVNTNNTASKAQSLAHEEVPDEEQKRKMRAARFGISPTEQPQTKAEGPKNHIATKSSKTKHSNAAEQSASPQAKRKSILDDPAEAEKARKRALKFGITAAQDHKTSVTS